MSTLGTQRRFNYALQPMHKDEFIRLVTTDQPEAPPYFAYDAMLNRRERPTLTQTLHHVLTPLTLDDVVRLMNTGAQVVDVRDPEAFETAHLTGSVNIGLQGNFATWAGTVLAQDTPIVLIADPGKEEEAAMRLGRIGFDHIRGYLAGGAQSLKAHPELVRSIKRLTATELATALGAPNPPLILDVRGPGERADKYIAGSLHLPLNQSTATAQHRAPRLHPGAPVCWGLPLGHCREHPGEPWDDGDCGPRRRAGGLGGCGPGPRDGSAIEKSAVAPG